MDVFLTYESLVVAVDGVLPLGVAITSSLPPNIIVAMETEADF